MPPPSMQQDFSIKVAKIRVIADKQNGAVTEFEALFSSLLARAFSGELTAAWRERRGEQLAAEVAQRDRLLAERGAARTQTISPPSIPGTSHVFAPTIAMRGPRDAVLDCLSEEQRQIWRAMQEHDSYLNAEAISQSYDLPLARARQTLELLASAGLLLPVALWNSEISDFVAAYRRLRPATGDEEQSGDEAYADDVALLEAQ